MKGLLAPLLMGVWRGRECAVKKITELMVDEKEKGRDRTIQSASTLGVLISSYDPARSEDGGFLACLLMAALRRRLEFLHHVKWERQR